MNLVHSLLIVCVYCHKVKYLSTIFLVWDNKNTFFFLLFGKLIIYS